MKLLKNPIVLFDSDHIFGYFVHHKIVPEKLEFIHNLEYSYYNMFSVYLLNHGINREVRFVLERLARCYLRAVDLCPFFAKYYLYFVLFSFYLYFVLTIYLLIKKLKLKIA